MFEDLELAIIDKFQDYISQVPNVDEIHSLIGLRDGAAQMVEQVLEWAPNGVRSKSDED